MAMLITDVEVVGLRVPAPDRPNEWGEDGVVVRVHTDEGLVGVGETDSSPEVIRALIEAPYSHSTCMGLREALVGTNPLHIRQRWQEMYDATNYVGRRGAGIHAMSAIDIALWDIAGQYHEVPVYELLGGRFHESLPAYGTFIPVRSPADNAARAVTLKERGLRAAKFGGAEFGFDIEADGETIARVREAVGPDFDLMIDLVGRWGTHALASKAIERYEDYRLAWVEEPLPPDDHAGYARLSEHSRVAIAGGEALTTRYEFASFLSAAKPHVVQPDITRCGGITEMVRIADLAAMQGVRLVPHGFSTGILNAATIHFLVSRPEADLMEMSQSDSPLFTSLVVDPVTTQEGRVAPPDGSGLGVVLDDNTLDNYRIF